MPVGDQISPIDDAPLPLSQSSQAPENPEPHRRVPVENTIRYRDHGHDQGAALTLNSVSFRYRGRRPAIDGINLELGFDEGVVGVFGPNGAGKTTLMRVVAGLLGRYSGSCTIGGGQRVVFLPDARIFDGFLRVRAVVDLVGAFDGGIDSERALSQLDRLGVNPNDRVGQLSSGMKEKLAIIVSLARRADVYLLDEPLAAVDPLMRDELVELIELGRAEPRSIVLLSTHIMAGLSKVFDNMIVVHDGRVVAHEPVNCSGQALEEHVKELLV